MNNKIGDVVISTAGRDAGYLMCVVGQRDEFPLVCNGKERPVERPKAKNPKHIRSTGRVLDRQEYKSNKSLKKALNRLKLKEGGM